MPIQAKILNAPMVFIATTTQPTLQAPMTEARHITVTAPGFGYECLTLWDDGNRLWAALLTSTAGIFAEWVVVRDRTKSLSQPDTNGYVLKKIDLSNVA